MDAKAMAALCETDAKTFRRFVRSHLRAIGAETAGKGGRYVFDEGDADAIIARFDAWRKGSKVTIVRFDEADEA